MRDHTVVADYLAHFCSGDIDGIESTLAEDFRLVGPSFEFDSRESYMKSLRDNPPEIATHSILEVSQDDETVSIFYEYRKPAVSIVVAQFFRIRENKIVETILVFDPGSVT